MRFSTVAALGLVSVANALLVEHCTQPNTVALTFDDGPFQYTNTLLDTLKAANIKATFFINGENYWPDLALDPQKQTVLKRAHDEGHQIASHTWKHEIPETSPGVVNKEAVLESLGLVEDLIFNNTGVYPTYFRAPKGEIDQATVDLFEGFGYKIIQWDVDPNDWNEEVNGKKSFKERVKVAQQMFTDEYAQKKQNYLVLMHDVQPHTVQEIVPFIIQQGLFKEYKFVTVAECLGDATGGWGKAGNARTVQATGAPPAPETVAPANTTVAGNSTVPGTDADKMNLERSGAITTVNFSVLATLLMSAVYMLF